MRIGLDFGTTNSAAAIHDGRRVHALPLDPAAHDPAVVRSTLYVTRHQAVYIGQEAIDAYYAQNTGRPSRMLRKYVGDIEMTFGDVGTRKGYPSGPSTYYQRVYALIDELTPGRLLHSLKSGLAAGDQVTVLFGREYSVVDLIALYLTRIRVRIEEATGEAADSAVIGRPVRFAASPSEEEDDRCEAHLRVAAIRAGFVDVVFELEPVAAALDYGHRVADSKTVLVFDLGGGTLDTSVVRLSRYAGHEVLATGGLPLGGEEFDRRIAQHLLLDHLGRGATWGEPPAPLPEHYTHALMDWKTLPSLGRPEALRFLHEAEMTSDHPSRIAALASLITNNYAVRLLDAVEGCRIAISERRFDVIKLTGDAISIWQPLTRSQFELLISDARKAIEECVLKTLTDSGRHPSDVDAVVQTGGAAHSPFCTSMLGHIFGPHRLVRTEAFTGVAAGLAIRAAQIDGRAGLAPG